MNKIILILTLLFSSPLLADEVKDQATSEAGVTCNTLLCKAETPYYRLASQVAGITEKACRENRMDDNMFLDPLVGCLTGHWEMGKSTVLGLYEFFKLILYELPKWNAEQNVRDIATIMTGDMSPSKIAGRIANVPVARAEIAWKKAQEYWETFKKFAVQLKNDLIKHSKGFFCKPRKEQYEIMCRAVDEVFLTVMGPGLFINGAKWGIKTVNAVGDFVRALRAAEGAKGLSTVEKINFATDAVNGVSRASSLPSREILKLRNASLTEVTLPSGKTVLRYTRKEKDLKGNLYDETTDVAVDSKTRAIDANADIGKVIVQDLVLQNRKKGSFLFIDINDLGVVNHFPGKVLTGDTYLSEVADSIRSTLRSDDIFLKYGGDELVVILPENDPKLIREITQRMSDKVYSNPKIREIFNKGFESVMNNFKEIKRVTRYDDLSNEFKLSLTAKERELARINFEMFKKMKTRELEILFEKRTSRGSISVGATVIREGDIAETALLRANEQSDVVKANYKTSIGQDTSKYGTDSNIETATIPITSGQGPVTLDPTP